MNLELPGVVHWWMTHRAKAAALLVPILTLLVACGPARDPDALKAAEPLPADVTDGRAYLVDLCDDEQASRALDGGDLKNERRNVGAACGPNASEDGIRYVGWFDGREPFYRAKDREKAIAEVRAENRKYERASRTPGPDEYFASPKGGECASHGLKDYRRWAKEPSSVKGDFDGDGREDRFVVYATGPEFYGGDAVRLRIELGSGVIADREAYEWSNAWEAKAAGTSDVNGDGHDEAWVWMHGNKSEYAGVLVFDDCDPLEVTLPKNINGFNDRFITGTGGNPPPFEHAALECSDADGNGSIDIVQTFEIKAWTHDDSLDPREPHNPPSSPYVWDYRAVRLVGRTMHAVARDNGTGESTRPKTLAWSNTYRKSCGLKEPKSD